MSGPPLGSGPGTGGAWFERLAERERTRQSKGGRTATPARARDVAELGARASVEPYRPGLVPRIGDLTCQPSGVYDLG